MIFIRCYYEISELILLRSTFSGFNFNPITQFKTLFAFSENFRWIVKNKLASFKIFWFLCLFVWNNIDIKSSLWNIKIKK